VIPSPLNLGDQFVPLGEGAAEVALGQFEHERGDGLSDCRELRGRQRRIRGAARYGHETVETLVGPFLSNVEMTLRMKHDAGAVASVGVDPQDRLLGHGAVIMNRADSLPRRRATSCSSSSTTPPLP